MNRNYIPMTGDSLLREACRYYDRHGTPNERMRAHYLLGCAYRDMGEAPRAIESYQNAISRADTNAVDCDFRKLGCVYSQMADVYHRQLLFFNEIQARKRSRRYGLLSGDTIGAVSSMSLSASAFILLNHHEEAEVLADSAMRLFQEHGHDRYALEASTLLMYLYKDRPERKDSLRQLIIRYDSGYCLFNENHELPPSKRQFYYYKGKYFELSDQLDSAEVYYRKMSCPSMSPVAANPMYKGLLGVFQRRHSPDSIAKYARLYCEANDSSIAIKDQDLTARMTASYNYARYQSQSLENARKANHRMQVAIVLLIIAAIAILAAVIFRHRYHVSLTEKRIALEKIQGGHAEVIRLYEEKLSQLHQLEDAHQRLIQTIQWELEKVRGENTVAKNTNEESARLIANLNNQYNEEKARLSNELHRYIDKAERLERQLIVSEYRKSIPYLSQGVVKRVKLFAEDEKKRLSKRDLKLLVQLTSEHFPDLISSLHGTAGIGDRGLHVCVLVLIGLSPKEITHLLGISSSQVGNLKQDINQALFQEDTATTLYKNLLSRYKMVSV
jgi:hypothetical protein